MGVSEAAPSARLLVVDNQDSFTWNLVHLLHAAAREAGVALQVDVERSDVCPLATALAHPGDGVLISPGPGRPPDAGISLALISALLGRKPLVGVCLGHQALVHALGGRVVSAPRVMHGKTSRVTHDGRGLFAGLPQPLEVMRYHSLVVDAERLPAALQVSARTAPGDPAPAVMAVRHRRYQAAGVQFHPESVGTPDRLAFARNLLAHLLPVRAGADAEGHRPWSAA